ncbi:LANO_0F03774g1_1 [Lachancea nothofagi CBS 11611]|uniref:LANO_0F03774g1_1 n=1 Tax=Lachancea nothofagi CBS 11611 TaxID=1266666 RepID=A0A1G4K788_9SACH|nr:LANO_0F03774g1_1 [Lachancea nothofagi CBS 11611]
MLQQTLKATRTLQGLSFRAARSGIAVRCISNGAAQSKTPDGLTQEELDSNKKKLEELEKKKGGKNHDYERPSRDQLKKRGDDAQVEQQRPDDGVY